MTEYPQCVRRLTLNWLLVLATCGSSSAIATLKNLIASDDIQAYVHDFHYQPDEMAEEGQASTYIGVIVALSTGFYVISPYGATFVPEFEPIG